MREPFFIKIGKHIDLTSTYILTKLRLVRISLLLETITQWKQGTNKGTCFCFMLIAFIVKVHQIT